MTPIADFFQRLTSVHLLFWTLTFQKFDAIALFVSILTVIGVNDFIEIKTVSGASLSAVLQFILYVLAFAFCYSWRPFRSTMSGIATNLVCLALAIWHF